MTHKSTNQSKTSTSVPRNRILLGLQGLPPLPSLPLQESLQHWKGQTSLCLALHRAHFSCSDAAGEGSKVHTGRSRSLQEKLADFWRRIVVLAQDGRRPNPDICFCGRFQSEVAVVSSPFKPVTFSFLSMSSTATLTTFLCTDTIVADE